jgi:hypothetical protein
MKFGAVIKQSDSVQLLMTLKAHHEAEGKHCAITAGIDALFALREVIDTAPVIWNAGYLAWRSRLLEACRAR